MGRLAPLLALLLGCQILYGVDERAVTGTLELDFVDTDGSGALTPFAISEYPASEIAASVILDDGSAPAVSYHDDGTFSFPLAHTGQAYRLRIGLVGNTTEYQLDQPSLHLTLALLGHLASPPAVTESTPLVIDVTGGGSAAAPLTLASTTGVWTSTVVARGSNGAIQLDWHDVPSMSGPLGLLDSTHGDRLYVVQFQDTPAGSGATPPSYQGISYVGSAAPFTQVNGMPATVNVALAPPVAAAQPTSVQIAADQTVDAGRLQVLLGSGASEYNAVVRVLAVPDPRLGITAPLILTNASTLDAGSGAPLDVSQMQSVQNPYPQSGLCVLSALAYSTALSGFSVRVSSGLTYFVTLEPGTSPQPAAIPTGGALDIAPEITTAAGTVALDRDGVEVAMAGHEDVTVSWRRDGSADLAPDADAVTLEQVPLTGTAPTPLVQVTTIGTAAVFASDNLVDRQTYILRFDTLRGIPGAAAGDWAPTGPTEIFGTTWSSPFTITRGGP